MWPVATKSGSSEQIKSVEQQPQTNDHKETVEEEKTSEVVREKESSEVDPYSQQVEYNVSLILAEMANRIVKQPYYRSNK